MRGFEKRSVYKADAFGLSKPLDLKAVIRKSFALTHNICFANVSAIIPKALWKQASNSFYDYYRPLSNLRG